MKETRTYIYNKTKKTSSIYSAKAGSLEVLILKGVRDIVCSKFLMNNRQQVVMAAAPSANPFAQI